MIYWLLVTIFAYLFFGVASLCDKLVLAGKPKPGSYTFYVGVFGFFVALAILPFSGLNFPSGLGILWIVVDAIVHILGLYAMYLALERFEVSRVMPTIGAAQPLFVLILAWIFWGPQVMKPLDVLAFFILFVACVIISLEKTPKLTGSFLKITLFSSLMFSLDYVFLKLVFSSQPFLQGIVWIQLFIFLFAMVFLFSKKSRKEIFSRDVVLNKKTDIRFLGAQASGGAGNFLQSLAISLVPVEFLAIVNSLRGIQYAFLFFMTLLISIFIPKILKEELSKKIIFQKVIAIALIVAGLAILVF